MSTKPAAPPALSLLALLLMSGAGLWHAPQAATDALRTAVRDALRPGQLAVLEAREAGAAQLRRAAGTERMAAQLERLQREREAQRQQCRQLMVELALVRERERAPVNPLDKYLPSNSAPLLVPELIAARLLGDENAVAWRAGKLLSAGNDAGVREASVVLDDPRPLVDLGSDNGLADGHPVYASRCVVGKISNVGRWTSTLQLLTDVDYRGRAQLVRQTALGPVFGAEGVLEGSGTGLCRLKRISATLPVSVGDLVCTASRDGLIPYPMHYGTVVRAELNPAEPYWEIDVKPAANLAGLNEVLVLRLSPNPVRLLAN